MAIKPRHKRRFFWGIIGFLGLIVVGALVAPMFINLNSMRPRLEQAIQNKTGIAVKINGDVNFGILGRTTINAHNVTFANGEIKSLTVSIPFSGLFDLENANLDGNITVSGAKVKVSEISARKNNYNVSLTDSVVQFMGKDYQIINGEFHHGKFSGVVRTDQHKYDISFQGNEFKIRNKNVKLLIEGELYSNGGASGIIEIDTNKINEWFEFSEPKITTNVKLTMKFWWDGQYRFKFSDIDANDVHGNIELFSDGAREIHLSGENTNFDFSFLARPTKFLTNTKLDLDFYGDLLFEKWKFEHLLVNATGVPGAIKIHNIIADDISFTNGTIDANGAHNVMIETVKNGTNIKCLFSGTPDDWQCAEFVYGDISGNINISKNTLNANISSQKITEISELVEMLEKFDTSAKHMNIKFKFPNMAGTYTRDQNDAKIEYNFVYGKSISWLKPNIKLLPEFMLNETGNFVWQQDTLSFIPKSKKWALTLHNNFFFLTGSDAKSWFGDMDLRALNNFDYSVSGYYNEKGDISDLTIKIANHTFSGSATKDNITLKTDVLVLDSFVNQEYVDNYEEMEFLTNAPIMLPFDINKNIYLSADTLIYNGDSYNNFVYSLKPGVQTFSITDKSRGNLLATIIKERLEYDIFIQLNKFVINGKLMSSDFPLNIMDTSITAEIDLTTSGYIAHDLWYNMRGTIDLTLDGGYIVGLGLDSFYDAAANLTRLNMEDYLSVALTQGMTKLKNMRIQGKYENGDFETTTPARFSTRHVDTVSTFEIKDGAMTSKMNLLMRGTSPTPMPVSLTVLPNGKRTYSVSDVMRNFDPVFMRSFIKKHNKF